MLNNQRHVPILFALSLGVLLCVMLGVPGVCTAQSEGEESLARLWVRIEDEQGQPITARIYLRDAVGQAHAPSGSLERQHRRFEEHYFHAAGQFQMELPAGPVTVEAVKGFEYVPAKAQVDLTAGLTNLVTLKLRRFIDMPALGWYSGDVHMHPNHVLGGVYMTMADCLLQAAGEDIRVANLLISNTDAAHVYDTEFFNGGRPDALSSRETMLVVQEEFRNTSGMYGHMVLLGISSLVEPFFTGLPDSAHWEDHPPNYAVALAAQTQGGVVSYAHPAETPEIPVGLHIAREFPVDLALGVVDALDIVSNLDEEAACWMYYHVLNCGLKCIASAGTDSRMDVMRHTTPGGSKVYVQMGDPFTYERWVEGYRAGRTFVTNGPMLFFEVDGRGPGTEIRFPELGSLTVKAHAQSQVPMEVLEILVNGEVAAAVRAEREGTSLRIEETIQLDKSSWVAARVWGGEHRLVVNDPKVFAHTTPVYCNVNDEPIAVPEDAKIVVAWIERLLDDVRTSPRFASEERRQEVISLFEKGKGYYERIALGR